MKIGICGISGRMGHALMRISPDRNHFITGAYDSENSPYFGSTAGNLINSSEVSCEVTSFSNESLKNVDGIIDFSAPLATLSLLEYAVTAQKPVVIGTTGFTADQKVDIEKAAQYIPVLFSPNMSLGVNLLFKLTEIAAQSLNTSYDVEIVESHHRHKKDAPSGTAKRLIESVKTGMKELQSADEVTGRDGIIGERSDNEIGVFALRGGDIVGEHTVNFIAEGERIELTHRASSRDTFAMGAVQGLEYLAGRDAGLYTMFDVLGLS